MSIPSSGHDSHGQPGGRATRPYIPVPPATDSLDGSFLDEYAEIFRNDTLTVDLGGITVHSSGFFIKVVVQVSSRGSGDAALMSALGRLRSVLRSEGNPPGVYPVFGMDYGALLEVPTTSDSRPGFSDQIDPSVEQALIFYGNASRPLDDGGYRFEVDLWSWPLPPPRALTMTLDWPVVGVENVALRVDGAAIVSAAV